MPVNVEYEDETTSYVYFFLHTDQVFEKTSGQPVQTAARVFTRKCVNCISWSAEEFENLGLNFNSEEKLWLNKHEHMTPCSLLISPAALWPRGPEPEASHPLSPSFTSRSTLSIPGPLTSSQWWSNLKHTGQRNLPRKNICWGDCRATHSRAGQSISGRLPAQDLLEMVGNFPFGVALLSFKSAIFVFCVKKVRAIVFRRVNTTVYCSSSGAFSFFPCPPQR